MMEEAVASYYDKQENEHASRIIQHQIKLAEIMNDKWDVLTASIIQVIKKIHTHSIAIRSIWICFLVNLMKISN